MKKFIPYIILLSVTLVIACCKGDDRRHDDIQHTNILNTNLAETVNTDSPTISIREHEMEIRRLQTKFIIALIVIVSVSILVYFVFLTKLNRKNIAIIRQAKETEQAEKLSAQALRQMPRERLDLDQLLYSKLLDIMEGEQKPYTDLACNRETLAKLCATNGKYIDRVISHFADGKTTNEFITHYRLRRAMTLLADTDETVDAIAELCGFSSSRTFYRRFHDEVGMSPTEYRNLQTESELDGSL